MEISSKRCVYTGVVGSLKCGMRPGCSHVSPAASAKRQALGRVLRRRASPPLKLSCSSNCSSSESLQHAVNAGYMLLEPEMVRLRRDTRPYFRDAREKTGALTRGSAPTTHLRDIERASRAFSISKSRIGIPTRIVSTPLNSKASPLTWAARTTGYIIMGYLINTYVHHPARPRLKTIHLH